MKSILLRHTHYIHTDVMTYVHGRTYIYIYIYICVCVCVCVCVYVYVHKMYQNMKRNTPLFFWSSLSVRLRKTWRMGHSSIIPPEYPRMLRARERCSITGRGREVIDVNSDDNVTTPGLVWNGMGHTLESKLQDKNKLLHTHARARTRAHTHTHTSKHAVNFPPN